MHDWGFVRWNIFGAAANLCKKLQWNASKPRFSTRLLLCDQMKAEGDAAQVQASKTIKTNRNIKTVKKNRNIKTDKKNEILKLIQTNRNIKTNETVEMGL